MLCPKDLVEWVQKEKLDSILYDIELLPEQIDSANKVCALRGFQYGWIAREETTCSWMHVSKIRSYELSALRSFWRTECGNVADDPVGDFCPHCGRKIKERGEYRSDRNKVGDNDAK